MNIKNTINCNISEGGQHGPVVKTDSTHAGGLSSILSAGKEK